LLSVHDENSITGDFDLLQPIAIPEASHLYSAALLIRKSFTTSCKRFYQCYIHLKGIPPHIPFRYLKISVSENKLKLIDHPHLPVVLPKNARIQMPLLFTGSGICIRAFLSA
jgi:hypothetical protein